MPAKNANVGKWSQSGVFNGLISFLEFESCINQLAEEKDRGDVFEIFIEGYLATQSIAQCKEHWVVGSIPLVLRERYNLPSDGTGIDGIYEATDGTHVAYQVKYRQKSNLTYQEVAPFLGLTERFTDRVIFTNAATLAHQAVARTRWVSRQDFLSLTPEALNEITSWIVGKPVERKRAEPDPRYQTQVLADIATALETNSRATVVMACGTGKTLVALWAVEQAGPKTVLVLLPSLSLVQQTVREWARHNSWGTQFSFVCVCSDPTVVKSEDVLELDASDVGFRVDTDPVVVNRFLAASGDAVRVVFSTFQSSDVVAEGIKGLSPFDIAVFDEAHKTTGLAGGQFSRALSDDHIAISRRLFFTATPRHIDIRSKRDRDGEYKVQSMDDPAVYGPRAHTLSFKAAADKGVICPYRVVISVVDKDLVDDFARKNGITLVDGDEVGVRWVSNLVALQQAIEQTGATKVITFHSRVKLAEEFSSDSPRGIGRFLDGFEVRHVNGKQRSSDRAELIKSFAESPKGIITNARCLTEGVDIPAVDMVAFIDPRQSRVDIAQAVGRAMRKPRGETKKTVGYVFVPLFLGSEGESIDDAIKSERFEAVADVLNALQEHDEELVDLIREARQARGEGKSFRPRVLGDKVMMIGPRVELSRVAESVEATLVDTLGSSWDEWFGRLSRYRAEHGDCLVPAAFKTKEGHALGRWVVHQRMNTLLPAERRQRLKSIEFSWDPREENWNAFYQALVDYKKRYGHCDVRRDFVTDSGVRLGGWLLKQRHQLDDLSNARRNLLLDIGVARPAADERWEKTLSEVLAYKDKYKTFEINKEFKKTHGSYLDAWMTSQRMLFKRDQLTDYRKKRLEEIGFEWDRRGKLWSQGLESLRRYIASHGNADVPDGYCDSENFKLGNWLKGQKRQINSRRGLRRERLLQLNALGISWDLREKKWDAALDALIRYKTRFGNCDVPAHFVDDSGFRLGGWLVEQRQKWGVFPARDRRLTELGVSESPRRDKWEKGLEALRKYRLTNGNCDVPISFVESKTNFPLGKWLRVIRQKRTTIPAEKASELESLGIVWDLKESRWIRGYESLCNFKSSFGHCLVPARYVDESGFKLGQWVTVTRNKAANVPKARRTLLDGIGFVWKVRKRT